MNRVRRCSWETGIRCHAPATKRAAVTYLGFRIDHDPLFCDEHAARLEELLRPGWAVTVVELATEVPV